MKNIEYKHLIFDEDSRCVVVSITMAYGAGDHIDYARMAHKYLNQEGISHEENGAVVFFAENGAVVVFEK